MKEGAQAKATELGIKLMTGAGAKDGDNAGQVTALENMVNAGAKGILITPSDTKAIVPSIQKARDKGVVVIALDTATDPQSAVDALFATNNFNAGLLIGQWAKAFMAGKTPVIATLDLQPGITVGAQRHNGFLQGYGLVSGIDPNSTDLATNAAVVCSQDTHGDQTEGQTAMENCLTKNPNINLVYTINEPAAFGAYTAIKNAGKAGRHHHRLRRRRLPGRPGRGRRQDRRDVAAVSAQDGIARRPGAVRLRHEGHQAERLHGHGRHAHHGQGPDRRGQQGLRLRRCQLLGHQVGSTWLVAARCCPAATLSSGG